MFWRVEDKKKTPEPANLPVLLETGMIVARPGQARAASRRLAVCGQHVNARGNDPDSSRQVRWSVAERRGKSGRRRGRMEGRKEDEKEGGRTGQERGETQFPVFSPILVLSQPWQSRCGDQCANRAPTRERR